MATAVALGVPLGALTFALQLTPFGLVANSPAFWAMWGFAAGAIVAAPRAAVLTATGVELLGLVSWYTTSWLTGNFEWSAGGSLALGWGAGALAAGMVFGLAGAWWRTRATTPRLEIATAVPVSVFACAAVYYAFILNYTATATYNAAVALLLLAFLPPANRDRLRAAAAVIPITALGIAGGAAFITFLNAASGT
ncbi:hypothetical protein BJP25_06045 [Actinokineospora bangkokensis]|uniref:Uncharacterized protein n=1 Tax=Actinokineospora bangkokensis TaxID=1193682 RepID=A0A1Q9LTI4_9PSEU|nr:hypothetical protein BJP25_06045 [Actinokineospora bangkokensis]